MNAFIKECIKANKEIYEYLTTHISSTDYNYSNTIGVGGDNSLNIDLICEKLFINYLLPYGDIYTEEAGFIKSDAEGCIIIDPLDGSHNLQSGLPYYGTSVAFERNGKVIYSVICNLSNHTLIYKEKNNKIEEIDLLTEKKITNIRSKSSDLGIFERAYAYPEIVKTFWEKEIKFRSPGAVALSLAYSQNYSFVLFAGKIRDFDIKAALHICSDLFVHKDDEFLIITKNYDTFVAIKEIIKE